MVEATIRIRSAREAATLCQALSALPWDVDASSGGRRTVDAKSIMGLMSLDLASSVILTANTDDPGAGRMIWDAIGSATEEIDEEA